MFCFFFFFFSSVIPLLVTFEHLYRQFVAKQAFFASRQCVSTHWLSCLWAADSSMIHSSFILSLPLNTTAHRLTQSSQTRGKQYALQHHQKPKNSAKW
uniref:Putative secreted protein ovary overexpressed n=1 Tax=Rhipicephalus microplus TaxID=6941 RepID=A0A6M2D9X6_RHIMP